MNGRRKNAGGAQAAIFLSIVSAFFFEARAGEAGGTLTVERTEPDGRAREALPYLHANRDFFRARLDRLREIYRTDERGEAAPFDEWYLELERMLREAEAGRDSAAAGEGELAGLDYLRSISDLAWLEGELDRMEELLAAQEERLARLGRNYVDAGRTELMIYLRGFPPGGEPPEGIVIDMDGERTVRVALDSLARSSLRKGGLVKVFRRRVEPMAHDVAIGFDGASWIAAEPAPVPVEAAQGRLTLLDVDLASLRRDDNGVLLNARRWVR